MHPTDRYRKGGIETWRWSEGSNRGGMEVLARVGTLHERMALPTRDDAKVSDFLRDDGKTLDYDTPEREVAHDVFLARSATGGLSLRTGRLREILAEAEVDARLKLAPQNNTPTE